MNNIESIINILKNIPEPFSVDGIIKSFEKYSKKIIGNFAIYFNKTSNNSPALWYSNFHFDKIDMAKQTIERNSIITENGFISFPLFARGVCFGAIIIEDKNEKDINILIDYLSMILYSEKLSFLANRDKLTTLYNRGYILKELEKKEKSKETYSIIIADIDRFKHYNDSYGHNIGDHILKLASKYMKKTLLNVSKESVLARYGGEEFIVVSCLDNKNALYKIMETLRKNIEQSDFSTEEYSLKITASFGGAIKNKDIETHQLIDLADKSLYKAKETGRNKSVILD